MTDLHAALLGVIQGAGEFLPISSSAHLALAPYLLGGVYQGLAFDVMLHAGTLAAVLLYFYRDWLGLFRGALRDGSRAALWKVAAATVPGGLAGLFLNDLAETAFRRPEAIAANLLAFSLFIWLADRRAAAPGREEGSLSWKDALLIGCAQALAIMPGASRSGVTIMAALLLGFGRPAAARVSFLLAAPLILGAVMHEAPALLAGDTPASAMAWGFAAAFLSGLAAIKFLISYLGRRDLRLFIAYRVVLGAAILRYTLFP